MDLITKHLIEVTLVDNLSRFEILATLGRLLLPSLTSSAREKHARFSHAKVQKRLDAQTPREDFFTSISSKVRTGEIPQEEMAAHASTIM